MFTLSKQTRDIIREKTGLTVSQIVDMSFDDEMTYVERRIGKKIRYPQKMDPRKIGRGNPYLVLGRFKTIEQVDRKISKICKDK